MCKLMYNELHNNNERAFYLLNRVLSYTEMIIILEFGVIVKEGMNDITWQL